MHARMGLSYVEYGGMQTLSLASSLLGSQAKQQSHHMIHNSIHVEDSAMSRLSTIVPILVNAVGPTTQVRQGQPVPKESIKLLEPFRWVQLP